MTQATFVYNQAGSECMTTLDVSYPGLEDIDAAELLEDFIGTAWQPWMATTCDLVEIRLGDAVWPVTGGAGLGETHACPANCALIVQKNTNTNVRGRMFLPGVSEPDVDSAGRVGTELRALVTAAFNDARSDLIAAGVTPNVHSGIGAGADIAITSFAARPLIATLRNRIITR